jgi:hypothetical protein
MCTVNNGGCHPAAFCYDNPGDSSSDGIHPEFGLLELTVELGALQSKDFRGNGVVFEGQNQREVN